MSNKNVAALKTVDGVFFLDDGSTNCRSVFHLYLLKHVKSWDYWTADFTNDSLAMVVIQVKSSTPF